MQTLFVPFQLGRIFNSSSILQSLAIAWRDIPWLVR